jgi:hypothetical protein
VRPANPAACIAHIRTQISEADHRAACALIDLYAWVRDVAVIGEAHRIRRAGILSLPITADEVREAEEFLGGRQ